MSHTLPVPSLIKLWFQTILSIACLTSMLVHLAMPPEKLNKTFILYFNLWVILYSLSQVPFLIYQATNFLLLNADQGTYIMKSFPHLTIPSPTRTIAAQPFLLCALGVKSSGYITVDDMCLFVSSNGS